MFNGEKICELRVCICAIARTPTTQQFGHAKFAHYLYIHRYSIARAHTQLVYEEMLVWMA